MTSKRNPRTLNSRGGFWGEWEQWTTASCSLFIKNAIAYEKCMFIELVQLCLGIIFIIIGIQFFSIISWLTIVMGLGFLFLGLAIIFE
jgi:hypothetical protein